MKKLILSAAILFFTVFSSAASDKVSLNSSSPVVDWHLVPVEQVSASAVLSNGCDMSSWVKAVVPGATFTSYVEAGLEPDPNYGDNAYKVDKSKYAHDMWYRTEIATEDIPAGECRWLCFEGINRKGDIYFNGKLLGHLDGFMDRGHFDVAPYVKTDGSKNVLSVLVHIPVKPIPNLASPTYISSDGWDWMPSVPGLLGGITDDVYFYSSGKVTLENVWTRTRVPSQDEGIITIQTDVCRHDDADHKIVIKGVINPGNITFEKEYDKRGVWGMQYCTFTEKEFPQLNIKNPALWWPNGYGDQNLYECTLTCYVDGEVSDVQTTTFGIREYTYNFVNEVFQISCNGERIFCKGGNWGMSEYMLRCRGEEYDLKVRLHKEMNYNMIRNWIGSTTDDEFYQACDKYGIMVFDDFWLNSHPNLPTDVFAFNKNAVEKIKRLRNHPSIAVWCGDNEGVPVAPLNEWLREDVRVFDGADRWYQPISREYGLSGSGPWVNAHPIWYFTPIPAGFGEHKLDGFGFRSEIGTAVFVNYESLVKFFPNPEQWPLDNDMLEKHFFGRSSFNSRPDRYFATVEYNYGTAKGTEDFCRKSQLVNYEVYKAMYEGWGHHLWNDASGIVTWMGQSAYPSLVWQTYDYYYDLNGAYWGVKDGCEPVHIQWSYADNSIKSVNTTLKSYDGVTVEARVYNMDGTEVKSLAKTVKVNSPANRAAYITSLDLPADDNLARGKKVTASSTGVNDYLDPVAVTDGNTGSAWSAQSEDKPWVCVDLGEKKEFRRMVVSWESFVCEDYTILVSDDNSAWKAVHTHGKPAGSIDAISIDPVSARYIRIEGKPFEHRKMALHEIEVYADEAPASSLLSPVHFIRLRMTDASGKVLSENFYWRSLRLSDYTALNDLAPAKLVSKAKVEDAGDKQIVRAVVTNKGKSVAFMTRVLPVLASTGEQLTPVIADAGYFTLFPGESKTVTVEFDKSLLGNDKCEIKFVPFNN